MRRLKANASQVSGRGGSRFRKLTLALFSPEVVGRLSSEGRRETTPTS